MLLLLALLAPAAQAAETADAREFFEARVRPVLAKNCFACHTSSRMGGFEMKSREAFLKGGNSGPAVVPGEPEKSLLIQAIEQTHPRLKMPPGGKLKEEEIRDLAAWVKTGAVWPEGPPVAPVATVTPEQKSFWAFQPVRKPAPPKVNGRSWPKAPLDYFVLSALEGRGLKPVGPADKRTLIRRVSFDLIGLPPTPAEVDAFLQDNSREAFAKVVDRLLASPRYGERWGRHWLDVARYSDDKLNSTQDEPVPNAFRYRDWVIQAFNDDMPYDLFVKAQIAGDLLPDAPKYVAGLGFYSLRPEFQDDRVDATTRGFLGLTVACAQCHDHKYDPIPTTDYYALLGVFMSTEDREFPLASGEVVAEYKKHRNRLDDQEAALKEFLQAQSSGLGEILATKTARYLVAAWRVMGPEKQDLAEVAEEDSLDQETLDRWVHYLRTSPKEHPYLKPWDELLAGGASEKPSAAQVRQTAEAFQELVLSVIPEKKEVDEKNTILLGGSKDRRSLTDANLVSLERDKYFLWRDLFSERRGNLSFTFSGGVLYYGDNKIDRFLSAQWKSHLDSLRAELDLRKRELPPQYPYLNAIQDVAEPSNQRVQIRGSRDNLGPEAPRRFLTVLSDIAPQPFAKGSGRLELAEAIAKQENPLTARVLVNRIWQHHFGYGIVRTPSNFGQMGDRPDHPELLDYLAARLVENHWSIKALHREILLSATYALSAEPSPKNYAADPDNRFYWRANRQRLDAEELRDSMLYVAGKLDLNTGGPAERLTDDNARRTVYGFVSRRKLDPFLALFDFPNPASTSEQRIITNVPLQRLFFLNSALIERESQALAARVESEHDAGDAARIRRIYRLVYGRGPTRAETGLGLEFLRNGGDAWPKYAQVLLSSNEFVFVQ